MASASPLPSAPVKSPPLKATEELFTEEAPPKSVNKNVPANSAASSVFDTGMASAALSNAAAERPRPDLGAVAETLSRNDGGLNLNCVCVMTTNRALMSVM